MIPRITQDDSKHMTLTRLLHKQASLWGDELKLDNMYKNSLGGHIELQNLQNNTMKACRCYYPTCNMKNKVMRFTQLFNYHSSLSQYLIKWVRTYLNFIRSKEYVGFEVVYGFIDDIKICAWKYKSKHYRPCGIHCLLNNAAVDNCDCLCIKHCHTMHVHCIITKSRSKY